MEAALRVSLKACTKLEDEKTRSNTDFSLRLFLDVLFKAELSDIELSGVVSRYSQETTMQRRLVVHRWKLSHSLARPTFSDLSDAISFITGTSS